MPGGPVGKDIWDTYQFATRAMVRCIVGAGILLGLGLIIGGPERFASPGFATARLIPGQHNTWGVVFLAAGVTAAGGILLGWHRTTVMFGLCALGFLFAFLSLALAVTVAHNPTIAFTGVIIYGAMAGLCVIAVATGHGLRRA